MSPIFTWGKTQKRLCRPFIIYLFRYFFFMPFFHLFHLSTIAHISFYGAISLPCYTDAMKNYRKQTTNCEMLCGI